MPSEKGSRESTSSNSASPPSVIIWYISFSLPVMTAKPVMNSSSRCLRRSSWYLRCLSRTSVIWSSSATRARYSSSYWKWKHQAVQNLGSGVRFHGSKLVGNPRSDVKFYGNKPVWNPCLNFLFRGEISWQWTSLKSLFKISHSDVRFHGNKPVWKPCLIFLFRYEIRMWLLLGLLSVGSSRLLNFLFSSEIS